MLFFRNRHFEYVSYQRQGVKSSFVRRSHTLSNYPSDLKKKVTLLCHFKNYITENLSRVGLRVDARASFRCGR